jgi:NADH dehydrogenase
VPRDVVIAGGGFGGYYAAKKLERLAPDDVRITLINDVNFLLYAPLLPGAAASTLDPRHVVVPLREHLKRTELRMGWVTDGEPHRNLLKVRMISGETIDYSYDQLVVAMGSVSRTFPIPGLIEHAIGFKTIAEATALRNRVVRHLELAEGIDDPEERRPWLSFVFVGGGYAGLEGVAFLADFAADIIKRYPRCQEVGTRWMLLDAAPRIMPEIQSQLADFTVRLLEGRGIEFRLSTQLKEVFDDRIALSDGEVIPARTVCWTAGVKANPVAERMGLPLEKGRIKCDEFLRVPGFDNVWAVGDIAAIPDPARPGNPCPPTAQHAIRQGKLLARNLAVTLGRRGEVKPFTFKTLGSFAELGRHNAVANLMGLRLRGFLAWAVCRFYHLAWMPGLDRKSRLIADWSTEIIFPRDIAEMGQLGHPPRLDGPAPSPEEEPQPAALPDAPAEEKDSPAANQGTLPAPEDAHTSSSS